MKMDFRQVLPLFFLFTVAACGKQKIASETFQKPSEECAADVYPHQFVIRYLDHSMRTVYAASKQEFLQKYVEPDLAHIAYTEHDFYVHSGTVKSSNVHTTSGSADNWAAVRVGADSLWSSTENVRGTGVAVAVVDTGIDFTHPQLSGQILENPGETGLDSQGRNKALNGVDDDGNGFVDDFNGWDFIENKPLQGDYQLHGSHVSGIIAAAHSDNDAGPANYVQGIAPGAKILPLAFLKPDENGNATGMMSDGVRAIYYAASRGVRVINASWGGSICSRSLMDAVGELAKAGIIFVAAAGNGDANGGYNIDRYRDYPASFNSPTQFTVGATGSHDLKTYFSNFGSTNVHIFAPGEGITSTVPGGLMSLDGTSMAAPVVTGAIALLLSAEPTATAAQVRQALYNVSFKQGSFLNACHGRLNLHGALTELRHQMTH